MIDQTQLAQKKKSLRHLEEQVNATQPSLPAQSMGHRRDRRASSQPAKLAGVGVGVSCLGPGKVSLPKDLALIRASQQRRLCQCSVTRRRGGREQV